METGVRTLISSKLRTHAQVMKILRSGMGWRDRVMPIAIYGMAAWFLARQHQTHDLQWMPFVFLALAGYTYLQAQNLHRRIDVVVEMIGDEAIQRKLSGELKEIADLTAELATERRDRDGEATPKPAS